MAWRTVDVQDQRVRFVVAAHRGEKYFQELCAEFGISRPTGYEWLRRYQTAGIGEWWKRVGGRARVREKQPWRSKRGSWRCGSNGRTGVRASCKYCWRASSWCCRSSPCTGFYCAAGWYDRRIAFAPPRNASSAAPRTSCGRWTLKVQRVEARRWDRCRSWTITAVTRSRCRAPGARKQRQ